MTTKKKASGRNIPEAERGTKCPTCEAGIGDVCRDGQGDEIQAHTARIRLASGNSDEMRLAAAHERCNYLSRELSRSVCRIEWLERRVLDLEKHLIDMSGYAPIVRDHGSELHKSEGKP